MSKTEITNLGVSFAEVQNLFIFLLRVPGHIYDLLSKVRKCEGVLTEQGKTVDDEAISEILGTSTSRIRKARNALKRNVHLDGPIQDSNYNMHDVVEVKDLAVNHCIPASC